MTFTAGVYYGGEMRMNHYTLTLHMTTNSTDAVSHNVAFERIKFFVYSKLDSTIFINSECQEQCQRFVSAGLTVTTLPGEPVDQLIGLMLYYKLNAIMEDRMVITQLDISSALGDNVTYMHDEEDSSGPFTQPGWWSEPTVQHNTLDLEEAVDNIVKVVPSAWIEYGLMWPEESDMPTANTVVYANFPKNEN